MKITDLPKYSVVSKSRKTPTQTEVNTQEDAPFLQSVGTGAAKELGTTAIGLGTIGRGIQKGLSRGVDALLGTSGFGLGKESVFDKGSEPQQRATEFLTPEGGAEKLGSFATEAATFAIPGGAAVKATRGAGLGRQAAALGASDAAVTVAQSGELDRDAVDAAIIGAAFPVVGRGAQAVKSAVIPSGKEAGGRVINSLIKPLLKDFSYGKNPGQAVAEAGITANTLDELGQKITIERQRVGAQISEQVADSTNRFSATDALTPLDEAIENAKKSPLTNSTIITRLENLKSDLLRVDADGVPTRKLEDLSASELWEFNKDIGELTRWTGNATDDEIVNKALRNAYGNTRSKLESGVSGLDEISEKYANLKSAEVATTYRDKIAARQNLISFSGTQLGTAAAVTSAVVSGGAVIPILVGAGAAVGTESLKSPAVKTRAAAWLASASKQEREQAFNEAPWLRSSLQAALFDDSEESE